MELNEKEKYYIKLYRADIDGYNCNAGGNDSPNSVKLNYDQVSEIIVLLKERSLSMSKIAERYGVSQRMISGINIGCSWRREGISYPIRKSKNTLKTKCVICGKEISFGYSKCCRCAQRKVENRPDPNSLMHMIAEKGFEATGRFFGVSGKTISKWCKAYGLPWHKKDIMR